ncbi:hypothetical protein AYO44_16150 [Planctomycetaceae bacterium SCGC AG-212-F19]|nr:hypothetical protein AYO44_16150 [Planctomycetaceae bacterium SCGC AG-212-F19]
MSYSQLIQVYFDRCNALQWYWTLYVIVIGGVLGFSTFRQYRDVVTTVLVSVLYACFAYKNMGAIEATTLELQALLSAIKDYQASGPDAAEIKRVREFLDPTLIVSAYEGVRTFHVACDVMTIAAVWAKEWRRKSPPPATAAA